MPCDDCSNSKQFLGIQGRTYWLVHVFTVVDARPSKTELRRKHLGWILVFLHTFLFSTTVSETFRINIPTRVDNNSPVSGAVHFYTYLTYFLEPSLLRCSCGEFRIARSVYVCGTKPIRFSSVVKERVSNGTIPEINSFYKEQKKERTQISFNGITTYIRFLPFSNRNVYYNYSYFSMETF